MMTVEEIADKIEEAKRNLKTVAKEYGKQSHEYIDALEEIDYLKELYEFRKLHY